MEFYDVLKPLLLVVGCRPDDAWVRRYDGKNGAEVDAAIVTTYLMLAAENEGLATLWVGSFDPALLWDILPGAGGYELVAMINVGYSAPDSKPLPVHGVRKTVGGGRGWSRKWYCDVVEYCGRVNWFPWVI